MGVLCHCGGENGLTLSWTWSISSNNETTSFAWDNRWCGSLDINIKYRSLKDCGQSAVISGGDADKCISLSKTAGSWGFWGCTLGINGNLPIKQK